MPSVVCKHSSIPHETSSSNNIKSNKFGGYYENGKKFSKEKWSEICFIYVRMRENLQRNPTRKELAMTALISENSARRAIRMVKTGCYLRNELEERRPKEVKKVMTKTSSRLPLYEGKHYDSDLLQLNDSNTLIDPRQLQQVLFTTVKSWDWKLMSTPSPVFPSENIMSLVKEFYHDSILHATSFVSIVANVTTGNDERSPPKITLQQHPNDGMFVTRVECQSPKSKNGVTTSDFCVALSIDSLAAQLSVPFVSDEAYIKQVIN